MTLRWSALVSAIGVLASLFLVAGSSGDQANTYQVELNGHVFTLPRGFTIERIAGPPLVDRPITAAFDDQGRLYVGEVAGAIEKPIEKELQTLPHRIVRLEDTNGDGVFDKRVVFADKLMFPEGTMWRDGSLYVAAPPSIWKLTDTDGDGVADQRIEWFQGKTLTGCANDLHGPYLGPDGWIYWCKGAFAPQTYERPGKTPFVTRSAHIFRSRPDNSGIEAVMTGALDNPVDVVFTPGGERIFSTTFLQIPAGGRRDGLIHAVYGGVYGKDPNLVAEHPWTGPTLLPPMTHHGPAASCGLHRLESGAWGAEYQDSIFACLFNLRKVTRHVLTPAGATFTTRDEDFVVSSNLDFHPTDVIEDADGSLLVIDTGGWYKLCCPTSQLVKPDVLGAIYRVRRTGATQFDDPRGRKIAWDKQSPAELGKLLADPRPVVRRRAIETLGLQGRDALPVLTGVLRPASPVEARRNAVWALTRVERLEARVAVRGALADSDESVRQVALHSISLWKDRDAVPELVRMLSSSSMHNRRGAAEALGRIGDRSVVPALRAALAAPNDRFLEHSLIFALIELGDGPQTAAGLQSADPRVRRAALIALGQMEGKHLDAATVAQSLQSGDVSLKETAMWLVSRHPEWGPELASTIRSRLQDAGLSASEREELPRLLGQLARTTAIQDLLAETLREPATAPEAARVVLRAMSQAGLKQAPPSWLTGLTRVLTAGRPDLLPDAVAAVRALPVGKAGPAELTAALRQLGVNDPLSPDVRLAALAALPTGLTEVSPQLLEFLCAQVGGDRPVATRSLAAEVLARARLNSGQLQIVAGVLKSVGPMEINRVLEAFGQSSDEKVGRQLLVALKEAPALTAVRADGLRQRLAKYGPAVQQEANELYVKLNADHAQQKAKLEQLLGSLSGGDVRRGQAVFHGNKTACISCHAIGYVGGKVGPDLTKIGQVRTERDLLEAVLFPGSSFVQGYETVNVATKDGRVFNGLMRPSSAAELHLVLNATQEVRLRRDDIEEIQPSKISVMPAGLEQQLSPQDLADLIAFLKACR